MRVAYFTSQYPKVSHTFIRREIAGVEAAGVEVLRIAVRRSGEPLVDELDRAELGRTRVLLDRGALALLPEVAAVLGRHPWRLLRALRLAAVMGWGSPRGLARHVAYLAEACLLLRWLREAEVDHLHVHFSTNPADVALLCRELGGPPFSFTAHRVQDGTASAWSIARKVAAARFVVAICEEGRRSLLEHCRPEDAHKIQVVRCAVDGRFLLPAPRIPPRSRSLVCVARHCPEKGLLVLLRAAGRLRAEGLRFELSLLGDGPDRPALERAARELGLQDTVRFLGWASQAVVHRHVAGARALVLSSLAEGLPVALMEALALHRPVIATAVNGVPELVENGVCGWLVPPGSDGRLADAMRAALTLPVSALDAMGARGARRVATLHDPILQVRLMTRLLLESRRPREPVASVAR